MNAAACCRSVALVGVALLSLASVARAHEGGDARTAFHDRTFGDRDRPDPEARRQAELQRQIDQLRPSVLQRQARIAAQRAAAAKLLAEVDELTWRVETAAANQLRVSEGQAAYRRPRPRSCGELLRSADACRPDPPSFPPPDGDRDQVLASWVRQDAATRRAFDVAKAHVATVTRKRNALKATLRELSQLPPS